MMTAVVNTSPLHRRQQFRAGEGGLPAVAVVLEAPPGGEHRLGQAPAAEPDAVEPQLEEEEGVPLPERENVNWQAHPHEKASEGLGKMFSVRRGQADAGA